MPDWAVDARKVTVGGIHRIVVHRATESARELTFFRSAPIEGLTYSSTDPFGDSVAEFDLPQVSILDDLTSSELSWLAKDTQVDIWWCPGSDTPDDWNPQPVTEDTQELINPLTEQLGIIAPIWKYVRGSDGVYRPGSVLNATKVYEGFIADKSVSGSETGSSWHVQCQGALYQVDLLLAKPYFPPRPCTCESLIAECFDTSLEPSLRTKPMVIRYPSNWNVQAPPSTAQDNVYRPNVTAGKVWTGYATRQTGSWDHKLTSFIQSMLSYMIVQPGSGNSSACTPGNQWTLMMERQSNSNAAGRTPVMQVRDRFAAPSFSIWAGTIGVSVELSGDSTQSSNADYGTGTDLAGTSWQNSYLSTKGDRTEYLPLAAHRSVFPHAQNPALDVYRYKRESYATYGQGVSQPDATKAAQANQQRNLDEGWTGSITIKADPTEMSRWVIQAGMTMTLKGFAGTGATGIRLHVAEVKCDTVAGTVSLTVDTRYRDLLSIAEARIRARDALTPSKLLQLNRNSVTIEDIQAPWDYTAGSGSIPLGAKDLWKNKPVNDVFPSQAWLLAHPPRKQGSARWYISCNARARSSLDRWSGPHRILMSQKGTIRRTEIVCVDAYGNILPIPFHVSLYYNNGIEPRMMPHTAAGVYSPFVDNAFQSIDPKTGNPFGTPGHEPDQSMVIGWGNKEQPAGYSPGLKSAGARPTGILVDESSWQFDCSTNNPNYVKLAGQGGQVAQVISLYAMFYAEANQTVYFTGRLYREEPGTSS